MLNSIVHFPTLICPLAMVMAAPEVKPAMTGWEMKSIRKPSLRLSQMSMMLLLVRMMVMIEMLMRTMVMATRMRSSLRFPQMKTMIPVKNASRGA